MQHLADDGSFCAEKMMHCVLLCESQGRSSVLYQRYIESPFHSQGLKSSIRRAVVQVKVKTIQHDSKV